MPNQPAGVFWAVVNRLLIIFQIIVLILSEVGWPLAFFDHFFPVLGSNFGVGPLGIFQCLIGATILSHHVDDFTLVAAFFLFALGCLNMLLGLIFREKSKAKRSILSWREEAKGVLPTTRDLRPQFTRPKSGFMASVFNRGGASADEDDEKRSSADYKGFGFGRQGEKESGYRGVLRFFCVRLTTVMLTHPQASFFRCRRSLAQRTHLHTTPTATVLERRSHVSSQVIPPSETPSPRHT